MIALSLMQLIDRIGVQLTRLLRACVALPPQLDLLKLPVVVLILVGLRLWPLSRFGHRS